MAFGIEIYEDDSYLYALMKERLTNRFPTAYIKRAGQKSDIDAKLIGKIYTLYDNRQYEAPPASTRSEPLPLFAEDGKGHSIIDMRRIYGLITNDAEPDMTQQSSGDKDRIRLLISYAYIDERENFIRSEIGPDSFDTIHPIRIDLMSGIRMPTPFTPGAPGSVTSLLRACTGKRFRPEQIPEYLNPDSSGFLSCGKPENEDDVFDIGIGACSKLMKDLRSLCISEDTGALVVAEGWRVSELIELIKLCDTLHLLLPARMCTEDTGMTKELGSFKRALSSGALMTVHYCEDYRHQYETINI